MKAPRSTSFPSMLSAKADQGNLKQAQYLQLAHYCAQTRDAHVIVQCSRASHETVLYTTSETCNFKLQVT
jgi:hypothetical protein